MGIDRTAKIVSIHGGQSNISPIEKEEIIEPSAIHISENSISTDSDVSDLEITYNFNFDSDGFPTDLDSDMEFSQYQFNFAGQESEIEDKKND